MLKRERGGGERGVARGQKRTCELEKIVCVGVIAPASMAVSVCEWSPL